MMLTLSCFYKCYFYKRSFSVINNLGTPSSEVQINFGVLLIYTENSATGDLSTGIHKSSINAPILNSMPLNWKRLTYFRKKSQPGPKSTADRHTSKIGTKCSLTSPNSFKRLFSIYNYMACLQISLLRFWQLFYYTAKNINGSDFPSKNGQFHTWMEAWIVEIHWIVPVPSKWIKKHSNGS